MARLKRNAQAAPSPSDLRNMLGANLRQLTKDAASISGLCRDLGINRTQFNRYLTGESFPRPDVLHRICTFFDVDARILLEPVSNISTVKHDLLHHPEVSDFVGAGSNQVAEDMFPSGFYRFSRRSFTDDEMFVQGLVYVYREDNYTFIRGYEAKEAMRQQGLSTDARTREFRGFMVPQEGGVASLISRRNSLTFSFNFLAREPSFENNFWIGYATRTVRETMSGRRVARQVYEHLGDDLDDVLKAARGSGFVRSEDLLTYHRTHLRVNEPFR
ncbi:Xre family transcriptional regulator [Primorskyibacter sedentarius]|uniref:Xre family transcriptional regulator n=2 Tax=Primorskyibacter sedentarius TaxID=745311 RepID=A0A4R3JKW7_9RHOB|nr:Xre family transcriptional regulator [Primorskyibacter sedentarius]